MKPTRKVAWAVVVMLMAGLPIRANTILFSDNFEGDLSQWTGNLDAGGITSGLIVPDPISAGHGAVLNLTEFRAAGDLFTILVFPADVYVSFDYLSPNFSPGNGYFGVSQSLRPLLAGSDHDWLAAPAGDGQWHHYEFQVSPAWASLFHVMFEDYNPPGGDAYFDNIVVADYAGADVPEPGPALLLLLGAGGLALRRLLRRPAAR